MERVYVPLLFTPAFFDVRVKSAIPDRTDVGVYTSDIPPCVINPLDTIGVSIDVENRIGAKTLVHLIDAEFRASELFHKVEETENEGHIVITNDQGEWGFVLVEKTWVIRSVMLYIDKTVLHTVTKDV